MRINALGNTATDFASDDYIAIDGATNGSRKMSKDDLMQKTSQNALTQNIMNRYINTLSIAYIVSVVNFNNTTHNVEFSNPLYFKTENGEKSISSGNKAYNWGTSSYQAVCYNLTDDAIKFVNTDALTDKEYPFAIVRISSNAVTRIIASSVRCSVDGVEFSPLSTDVAKLQQRISQTLGGVFTIGSINFDNTNSALVLDKPLYFYTENGEKSIGAHSYTYDWSSSNQSYWAVCYRKSTNALAWVAAVNLNSDDYIPFVLFRKSSAGVIIILSSSLPDKTYIDGVNVATKTQDALDEIDAIKTSIPFDLKATSLDAKIYARETFLRNKFEYGNETAEWYGVEWDEGENANNVTAIASDASLLNSTAIQDKMRRCVCKNGIVQYYLNADNSELKEDGTSAVLDGTDGNVDVEIPEFFYRHETETRDGVVYHKLKISEQGLPGFLFSPKRYTSAYEATINRTTNKLASVCSTIFTRTTEEVIVESSSRYVKAVSGTSLGTHKTAKRNGFAANAANFRGGNNTSSYDSYTDPSSTNFQKNQLGIPLCAKKLDELRAMCDDNEGQIVHCYDTYKALFILCFVEYKNRNIQNTALGLGATKYPDYNAYQAFFSPSGGASCLNCGVTNSLGNHSGEVYFLMQNVPVSSTGSGSSITYDSYGDVWMPVMSYRGVENFYGHLYKIMEQMFLYEVNTGEYVEGHSGESGWWLGDVTYYYSKNPYIRLTEQNENYSLGTYRFATDTKITKELLLGDFAHVVPIKTNTLSTDREKCYCDCTEFTRPGHFNYVAVNGRLVSGTLCGIGFWQSQPFDYSAESSFGTRVDHF